MKKAIVMKKNWPCMRGNSEGSSTRTKFGKRIEINQAEINQRRSSRRTPKRTVKSFVTIVTNPVMSNKTVNFPRNIQNT